MTARLFQSRSIAFKIALQSLLGFLFWCLCSELSWAQTNTLANITSTPGPGGSTNYSVSIQTLLTITALGFIPAVLLMMTGFTRIVIVLSLLRMALGTQNAPPNQVIIGLSLFLTLFVMSPVFDKIYADAYQPFSENKISFNEMLSKAEPTIKSFMLKQTRENDLALFSRMGNIQKIDKPEQISLKILVPAFVTSELKTAFQIGFMIFLPFIIIDMIVASVLMSMGMMMLSPVLISLPFKLMLFVLVDGWSLLASSLVASFAV